MRKVVAEQLRSLLEEGTRTTDRFMQDLWATKVSAFLTSAMGPDEAAEFDRLEGALPPLPPPPQHLSAGAFIRRLERRGFQLHAMNLGHVQGLIAKAAAEGAEVPKAIAVSATTGVRIVPTPDYRKAIRRAWS